MVFIYVGCFRDKQVLVAIELLRIFTMCTVILMMLGDLRVIRVVAFTIVYHDGGVEVDVILGAK